MAYLMARPLIAKPGLIKLWVGLFDAFSKPSISFSLDGAALAPVAAEGLFAIRDDTFLAAEPRNFQGVYTFTARGDGQEHRITVAAGAVATPFSLRVRSLPAQVPSGPNASFRILLASCYCASTDSTDVGRFVQGLPFTPDIALFAGDQVYLDQPPAQRMPSSPLALRREICAKYRRNWLSELTGQRGLQQALAKAPSLCLPDDHEYWNNYPWAQFWKPGTQHNPTATGLNPWDDAARELFQDYQLGGEPGTQPPWTTLDLDPLCMLFLDTRSHRQPDFNSPVGLMPTAAQQALKDWADKLLAHQRNGTPHIGVLATGQTLLCEPSSHPELMDAELANYGQFSVIIDVLDTLAAHSIQVVFLTGDVHWNRVAQAKSRRTMKTCLTEVICSPSSLCEMPVLDQWASLKNTVKGLFGASETWFRHSDPQPPAPFVGGAKQFSSIDDGKNRWKGNHVAVVEFLKRDSGAQMQVTYYPLTSPPSPSRSTGFYPLLNT